MRKLGTWSLWTHSRRSVNRIKNSSGRWSTWYDMIHSCSPTPRPKPTPIRCKHKPMEEICISLSLSSVNTFAQFLQDIFLSVSVLVWGSINTLLQMMALLHVCYLWRICTESYRYQYKPSISHRFLKCAWVSQFTFIYFGQSQIKRK